MHRREFTYLNKIVKRLLIDVDSRRINCKLMIDHRAKDHGRREVKGKRISRWADQTLTCVTSSRGDFCKNNDTCLRRVAKRAFVPAGRFIWPLNFLTKKNYNKNVHKFPGQVE